MKILAADTSTAINTVTVCEGECVLAETVVYCRRAHSERLLATVDWILSEAGLGLNDLDALAISIGPGSFTGLRVGTSAWKGLALGADLPLVAVPTLDAMTRLGVFQDALVCPMLDAKLGEVFGAVYRFVAGRRAKVVDERACVVEDLLGGIEEEVVVLGDGATRYRERVEAVAPAATMAAGPCSIPRASAVAVEALALLERGVCADPACVAPVYLRKSQAEEDRARRQNAGACEG